MYFTSLANFVSTLFPLQQCISPCEVTIKIYLTKKAFLQCFACLATLMVGFGLAGPAPQWDAKVPGFKGLFFFREHSSLHRFHLPVATGRLVWISQWVLYEGKLFNWFQFQFKILFIVISHINKDIWRNKIHWHCYYTLSELFWV